MFYDEIQAVKACEEEPSLIFDLINEDHIKVVDSILTKRKVCVNTVDENGNDVLTYLLKKNWYDLVLKHMTKKEWDVNHQNLNGDTFAHVLVTKKYLEVMHIINQLLKNQKFIPNIRNNNGETILDKSITGNYIYTSLKILEDERFNNIDLVSFKNLYEKYIKSNTYGKYSRVNNLEVIMDNLMEKDLLPKMNKLVTVITKNYDKIKEEVENNKLEVLDSIIYGCLKDNLEN